MSNPKATGPDNRVSRRNFKLSSLEMLLAAVVVVGVLYLAAVWVGGLFSSDQANLPGQQAGTPSEQVNQALGRAEKALAQLESMRKDLDALGKQVEELSAGGGSKDAGGDPRLARRVSGLEERLGGLRQDLTRVAKVADDERKLDKRLSALEKRAEGPSAVESDLNRLAKRMSELEKGFEAQKSAEHAAADLAKRVTVLEADTAMRGAGASSPALARRLESLEAAQKTLKTDVGAATVTLPSLETRLQRLELAQQKRAAVSAVRAPVPDGELAGKVESLESAVARLEKQAPGAPDQAAAERQAELERRLALLDKAQQRLEDKLNAAAGGVTTAQLDRRLDRLEGKVSTEAPGPGTSRAVEPPAPAQSEQAPAPSENAVAAPSRATPQNKQVNHKVRRGETLFGLARRYGVTVDDLRRWNPKFQKRSTLYIGENLLVYPANS